MTFPPIVEPSGDLYYSQSYKRSQLKRVKNTQKMRRFNYPHPLPIDVFPKSKRSVRAYRLRFGLVIRVRVKGSVSEEGYMVTFRVRVGVRVMGEG